MSTLTAPKKTRRPTAPECAVGEIAPKKARAARRKPEPVDPNAPLVRVLSYGGGLDSWVMLLNAVASGDKPDLVIFADVGDAARLDPAEWPATYEHLRDVVMPLCEREGIEFKWLGTEESPIRGERSLFRYFEVKKLIPSRQSRLCTSAAKVERIAKYLETRYPAPTRLEVWIGFESGEEERAGRDPHAAGRGLTRRTNRFPLMEAKLCRCRCEKIALASGLPVPPGSACVFCPFGSRGDFQTAHRELPEQWPRLVDLEANCRRTKKNDRVVRFAGTESAPVLTDWIASKYRRMGKGCDVCGAEVKAPKLVGCQPAERVMPRDRGPMLPGFGG